MLQNATISLGLESFTQKKKIHTWTNYLHVKTISKAQDKVVIYLLAQLFKKQTLKGSCEISIRICAVI